ncbi:MAG: 16S rRNA (cytidine(1402)-2'-O)-methyltransferase [Fimbriimonas sp.]
MASPIGNLGDLSPRAVQGLAEADFWIVEDTRVSGKLAYHLGLKKPMRVLTQHTQDYQIDRLVAELKDSVGILLTDGGSPAISDPGAILCDHCQEAGIEVDAIPGPSAVTNALALSGFFAQRFAFLGFLPRKPGPLRAELAAFWDSTATVVVFESPFRIEDLLAAASDALGPRRYAICREMTKMHQQVFRAKLPAIPTEAQVPRRGEFTIVFEGLRRKDAESDRGTIRPDFPLGEVSEEEPE